MAEPYLYLLIEESFRELRSRLLIAEAATRGGFTVILGQQWWFLANFDRLPAGIALLKGNNSIQANLMAVAKSHGHRVVSIEEEAFALRDEAEINMLYDSRIGQLCDMLFVQGEQHRAILARRFPVARDRMIVTGNPRVDALRLAASGKAAQTAQELVARHGDIVLVNTNCGSVNPYDFDAYGAFRRFVAAGVFRADNPDDVEHYGGLCAWERSNLRATTGFLGRMRALRDTARVVLRPHPSENPRPWHALAGRMPWVDIVVDDDHVPWTLASRAVVHCSSTTGLEAFLLDRAAIDLCVGESPWHGKFVAPVVNTIAHTVDAAVDAVAACLGGAPDPAARMTRLDALQPYLRTVMPGTSSEAIVAALRSLRQTAGATVRRLDVGTLVAAESSGRQRAKAFASNEQVVSLLSMVAGDPSPPIALREIGPSVWLMRGTDARAPA
jgi:surface carbohydrate biosynthesis protein